MLPNVEQWIASLRQYGLFSPQPDSPLDPREFQTSLKENTRRFLFPIFLLLALHYLAITAFRLVYLPDEYALHLLFLSTVPLLIFMGLAIWVKKHTLQIHRLYPVMTFAFLVLLLECTLHLHITQEPFQSTNFALIILGIGCLFLSLPWFIFNLALVFLAWGSASYAFSPTLFFHYFFMLFASTLLAGIVFVSRYRSALHKYQVIHQLSLAHQSLKHRAEEVEQSTREIQTQIKERQKYEFLLRQFIHNAPAPIAMLDRQFNILLYSKRWIEDFQLPEKDLSGQSLDQIFSHIPTQWKNALNNALLGEMFSCEEDRFFRPEGKTEWIRWEIRPWRQADGSIGGAVMFVELITEQKQAETSLQHSNHLLQALTNAQANFITHVEPRALFNDLLRNLLDLTQSEYGFIGEVLHTNTGSPYLKTYSISNIAWNKETLDFYEDNMPNGLEFHNMNTLFGWVITHKATMISNNPSADFRAGGLPGGHPALRAFLGIPFFGGDKMIGMIGIANRPGGYNEDIVNYLQPFLATCSNIIEAHKNNQRRETAEKALRDSEAKIRTILDNVVDAIVTIDESGAITSVNPAVETTFGYRPEELIGRNVHILMPSPFAEEHGQYITNFLQSGIRKVIGYGREAVAKRKDGSTFPIDLAVSEMDLEGRQNFIGILRDITERKEAEEHLTRISKAVESSSDAIFLGDKEGNPIYLNHAFIKRFGYSLHELLKQDLQSLFVHSNVKSKMQGLLHDNLTWNSEEEMRTKNGDMLTVDLRLDSIHDETGKVLGIIGILTDITKRKLTERALEERVVFEQFVTTISTKFINLPVHKIDSGIHDAIKAIGEYTGADRCLIFLYSDNLEYIEEVFEWGASNTPSVKEQFIGMHSDRYPWWNQQIRNKEFVYVRNTNQLPPEAEAEKATLASINATSLIAVPLMQDRDMIGFFGFHSIGREQDWTVDTILLLKILGEIFVNAIKRKKAENALRKSEESLQDFLDNANDLIQSVSPDGKFIYVNRAWQEALGYTEKEASQLTIFDIIHPESMDHCQTQFQQVLQGENLLGLETKFLTKSGKTIIVSGNANCRFENGIPVATRSIFRDITDSKRAAEELKKAKDLAEEANLAKSQFLANMSHELRTPLNSVIGFTNILTKNKHRSLNNKDLMYLERILSNGKHLLELINDVLDLSKIEAGKTELELTTVSLPDLTESITAQFETQVRDKGIALHTDLPPTILPIQADEAKLKQVLFNLVGNAVKFTETGSVTIKVNTDSQNDPVQIQVIDTGIGIPHDRFHSIFDAFKQADSSTTRKYGGTGLGLAISKSFCELMGYRLNLQSEVGEGSIFTIDFPKSLENKNPSSTSSTDGKSLWEIPPESPSSPGGKESQYTVLIIDDEEDSRYLLSHYFTDLGWNTITAHSGKTGLQLAQQHHPDLITLDLLMPEMDGKDVLKTLKCDPHLKNTPVFIISLIAKETDLTLLANIEFVSQPISSKQLAEKIREKVSSTHPRPHVLIAHADSSLYQQLNGWLSPLHIACAFVQNQEEAHHFLEHHQVDLILLDLTQEHKPAFLLLESLRESPNHRHIPILIVIPKHFKLDELHKLEGLSTAILQKGANLEAEIKQSVQQFFSTKVNHHDERS